MRVVQAPDPRAFASKQFEASEPLADSLDMVVRFATDVPLVVEGLLSAVAPQRENWRFCEIGFGSGWLLEEFSRRFPDASAFGLDLSQAFADHAHNTLPQAG